MNIQAEEPRIVLASASAARAALLEAAGLQFVARPAAIDEAGVKQSARADGLSADATALLLAGVKAERIARKCPEDLVIGCDQLLVCADHWFDKPADTAMARTQLQQLRGHSHTLVTAVLCLRHGRRIWQHVARPSLTMRDFSDAFLDSYLDAEGDAVLASVGAYRLEGLGIQLFERIEGEHGAILGLPMLPLVGFLRQHGVLAS
jgi:septum formation protein